LSEDSTPVTFSNVALTLISIIIALGIEHLLDHISVVFPEADASTQLLIVFQGATTFLTICSIWITYATQLMTAPWKPQFQDFFVPLLILTLLYFWISAIGSPGPAWFYMATVGSGISLIGNRFGLPEAVAIRLVPSSEIARPFFLNHLALLFLGAGGGTANLAGVLDSVDATILIALMATLQLLGAWFQFRWWRAAQPTP
jgi:hypothetical protein